LLGINAFIHSTSNSASHHRSIQVVITVKKVSYYHCKKILENKLGFSPLSLLRRRGGVVRGPQVDVLQPRGQEVLGVRVLQGMDEVDHIPRGGKRRDPTLALGRDGE